MAWAEATEGREGMPRRLALMRSSGTDSGGCCRFSRPTLCTGQNRAIARLRAL